VGTEFGGTVEAALDSEGNFYDIGTFTGTVDFDPGPRAFTITSAGERDLFISKIDSAGKFHWIKRIGNEGGFVFGAGVATDASGNVYATGDFSNFGSTIDFNPGRGARHFTSRDRAAFVLKLTSEGALGWAKKIDSARADRGSAIAVDGLDSVHIAGGTGGRADFDPGREVFSFAPGAFVTKWAQP
jgi:hypothetical protein